QKSPFEMQGFLGGGIGTGDEAASPYYPPRVRDRPPRVARAPAHHPDVLRCPVTDRSSTRAVPAAAVRDLTHDLLHRSARLPPRAGDACGRSVAERSCRIWTELPSGSNSSRF